MRLDISRRSCDTFDFRRAEAFYRPDGTEHKMNTIASANDQ
jgi:hypothetical protein